MKIVIICDVLGERNNGSTITTYNLIDSLKEKGHEVTVLCPDEEKKNLNGFVYLGKRNFGPLNFVFRRNGVVLAKANKKLLEAAIKQCDIVHCMMPFKVSIFAQKIARKYEKPVVASFHCQAENVTIHFQAKDLRIFNNYIYKRFYNKLYKYCDAVHYPTKFIQDVFEKVVGKTNGYVISNGVNDSIKQTKVIRPKEFQNKFIIFTAGRLCGEKSHIVLLKAIAKSKYKKNIQVIFAGVGPTHQKLKRFAEKNDISLIIKYFSRDEMVKVFNYSDLYVHPSEIELEGIACLEAVVCGLVPVVSDSNRAATKNLALGNYNLCKCNDSDDFKNKIEYWIENPQIRNEYKEKYLNLGTNFKLSECMSQMEKMFIEQINKRGSNK